MTASLLAQQSIPRFTSGVDVVQFTVTALDKERHSITGLTASDFEVLVDGKPKPLAAFAAVTLPNAQSALARTLPSVASDVETNQLPPEGRIVVVVMDRSTPYGQPLHAARTIADAAIDRLGPGDLAAVVFTSAFSRKYSQGITSDRARLHAAVAHAEMGAAPERRVELASEEMSGECLCGVCVVESLTAVARALSGGMVRHKSILFVGSDLAVATRAHGSDCEPRIYSARERLLRALDEANITFNVVDPRALEALGESPENAAPVGNADRTANVFRQESLAVLPEYTGGRLVQNTNKPEAAVGAILDESRAYYVLAVARDAAPSEDGRHRIRILVKRSGAVVHARNVYYAVDPKAALERAPEKTTGALNELLPGGDFRLQMNLVPQFGTDGSPEIRVLLGVASAITGKLDVLIRAFDHVVTPVAEPIKQRLDVPANAVTGSATFQWTSVLKPPPGDYEVRAAVATADGKHAANIVGYVDVPDVEKQGLALSGVTMKSGGAATVQREFAPGAVVGLSFQVAHSKKEPATVKVRYSLHDDVGQALAAVDVPHERAIAVSPAVDAFDIGVRLPPAPGRYVATVEASDSRRAVRRQVLLTVR